MIIFKFINKTTSLLAVYVISSLLFIAAPIKVNAATNNPNPEAKVTFSFDEGYDSTRTQAATTLAEYGYSGTVYVTTDCVEMTYTPNTCRANNYAKYITWNQISELKNQFGWEIGAHTKTHPYLASYDASDGQPNKISLEQVRNELDGSNAALASRGYNAKSFASPYGDYDMDVLAEIAKRYETHRGFADTGYNSWPNSEYIVKVQQVQAGVSVSRVKQYIDAAANNNQWLVLVFHDIKPDASTDPDDYEYSTNDLNEIAAYVKSKNLPVVNPASAVVSSTDNLLANSSFNNGITSGWNTDSPSTILSDGNNNGSYPDPTNSIKFTPSSRHNHLFSPNVSVDSNTTYLLKNFLNIESIARGELGFYIDEYDAAGNWISGQWKGAENSRFVQNFNFTYKPTSNSVRSASLQTYVTANSGITAYLDNTKWFPLTETVAPTPITNLISNGNFDSGISSGWRTDSTNSVSSDNNSNGSPNNALYSVRFQASNRNIHLFSPLVAVANESYNISVFTRINQLSGGELGFYIDEYDAAGNWISGQWKGARYSTSSDYVEFNYTPSSVNVDRSSLQIYITGNSGINAYIDDVTWVTQ